MTFAKNGMSAIVTYLFQRPETRESRSPDGVPLPKIRPGTRVCRLSGAPAILISERDSRTRTKNRERFYVSE